MGSTGYSCCECSRPRVEYYEVTFKMCSGFGHNTTATFDASIDTFQKALDKAQAMLASNPCLEEIVQIKKR